ncbi:glutathione S-transferase P-like [Babylonia areolata]|uniref:glutathione S-transferase P-like n=1 Tax=Babylonia areolata TaxID=304850 RepID=UPI003FD67945
MAKLNLVYFPVRGRGEAIRLLLKDNDQAYEETDPMPWDNFLAKWKPKVAFGQLPAIYDTKENGETFSLVQSNAILRYLARKCDLYGSSTDEAARIDELNDGIEDLRNAYVKLIYQNYEAGKAEYIEKLPGHLKAFENLLAASKADETGAAVGGKISFVDYNLFDLMDIHLLLAPGCLDAFPVLKGYYNKMLTRPKIAAYRETENFKKFPVNGNGKQ